MAAPLGRLALALLLPLADDARAQRGGEDEPISLADDPFEITDPIAARPGTAEFSLITGHDRARRGRWRGAQDAEAQLALGVAPGLEARFGQSVGYGRLENDRRLDLSDPGGFAEGPGVGGAGARDRSDKPLWGGATQIGALYQLNEAGGPWPTASLLQRFRTAYSARRTGYESETLLLLGHTLGGGRRPLGLSLNLGWVQIINPNPGERAGRYFVSASVGQAVARDTALVVTYTREQQDFRQRDFDLLQLGVRHRLPSGTVLGAAAGVGLTRDSPRFQIGVAAQWSLNLW